MDKELLNFIFFGVPLFLSGMFYQSIEWLYRRKIFNIKKLWLRIILYLIIPVIISSIYFYLTNNMHEIYIYYLLLIGADCLCYIGLRRHHKKYINRRKF